MIGSIIGGVKTFAGIVTGNPALIVSGVKQVAVSLAHGAALEPVKDLVGDGISDLMDAVS